MDVYRQGRKDYKDGKSETPPASLSRFQKRVWHDGYFDAKAEDPDAPEYTPEMNGTAIPQEIYQ